MSDEEDEARRYGEVFDQDDDDEDEGAPDVDRRVPQGCAWCLVSALLCIGGIIAWLRS